VAASGLPGYEVTGMTCMWAPVRTPPAIINRLSQEIVRMLGQGEVKERFLASGAETVGSSPQELAATMKSDMARMDKVIKDAGIRAD
jgi:tripartite-type tricarboxylate transporter receptor subunit TctC